MAVDWVVVSSLATAAGTLILAGATFLSIRSTSHSARVAERALMLGLRPLLLTSRPEDPDQPIGFADEFRVTVPGGGASADITEGAIYLTLSLRNAGSGLAVLHGWQISTTRELGANHGRLADFTQHSRDLYVAPADLGFWQGALRDPNAAIFSEVRTAITERARFAVEVMYGDLEGGQRTISRFSFVPTENGAWAAAVSRHWHLDAPDPR